MVLLGPCALVLLFSFVYLTSARIIYILPGSSPLSLDNIKILKLDDSELKQMLYNPTKHRKPKIIASDNNLDYDYSNDYSVEQSVIENCIKLGSFCIKLLPTVFKNRIARCLGISDRYECRKEPKYPSTTEAITTELPVITTTTDGRPDPYLPEWESSIQAEWTPVGSAEPYRILEIQNDDNPRKFSENYIEITDLKSLNSEPNKRSKDNDKIPYDYVDATGQMQHKLLEKDFLLKFLAKAKKLKAIKTKESIFDLVASSSESEGSKEKKVKNSNSDEDPKQASRMSRPKRFQVISHKKKKSKKKIKSSSEESVPSVEKENSKESKSKEKINQKDEKNNSIDSDKEKSKSIEIKKKLKNQKEAIDKALEKLQSKETKENSLDKSKPIESNSLSMEFTTKKPKNKRVRIPGKPDTILQAGRLYQEGKDFRKRMQQFLPKRIHWNPEDFSKLGYFWFNGPQGVAPGQWKIGY